MLEVSPPQKTLFQNTPHLNPRPQTPQPIQHDHPHDPRRRSQKPHRPPSPNSTGSHLIDKAAGLRSPPIVRHDPTCVALPIAGSLSPPSAEIFHLRKGWTLWREGGGDAVHCCGIRSLKGEMLASCAGSRGWGWLISGSMPSVRIFEPSSVR